MGTIQVRSLDQPDETRSFPNGVVEMVTIADTMVGRARFQPGWRWSSDAKPNGILIGSEDPEGLVAYYTRVFGEPGWAGGDFRGWQLGTGYVTVGPHDQEPYQPGEAPEGWIATFSDPDDNYFQLLSPME